MSTLLVNEIFHSIQGESTFAGLPCSFIRLAGCNLHCAWCDTTYAMEEQPRELPLNIILAAIAPHKTKLAEITGGEPLLQPNTPRLAQMLLDHGYTVLIETNGSLDLSPLPAAVHKIMDLKAPSSGMTPMMRMENFAQLRHGDEIKVVIADRLDYDWIKTIMKSGDYPAREVATLLSPAQGRLTAAELAGWILEDKLPVRLNLQLHKIIWPDQDRGV